MGYESPFWVPGVISTIDEPRLHLRAGHQHSQFWPILACFMGHVSPFWVPGVISTIDEPRLHLRAGHQHSQFWPILACFMGYESPFWVLGVISTINEPQGAFTCRSSTLAVLADSGLFHGLLITVLGPRSDFHH